MSVSEDGINFSPVQAMSGSDIFSGNTDGESIVINRFASPVFAQYVRLIIETFEIDPKVRWGVFGCEAIPWNGHITMTPDSLTRKYLHWEAAAIKRLF